MMKVLVNNVVATASDLELLTAGMINGRAVQFEFTPEWDSLNKTALFTNGEETRRVPEYKWENGVAYIPPEVLTTPHTFVKCGVYGIDDSGNIVIPTLWAELGRVFPSASPDEYEESVPPTPSAWEDLQRQIGNLSKLNTKEKDSLVKAINEVLSNSGGTGGSGFSPIVSVEEIDGGHRVSITDKEGTKTFDVMDGDKGDPYTLTEEDKQEIVDELIEEIDIPTDCATEEYVSASLRGGNVTPAVGMEVSELRFIGSEPMSDSIYLNVKLTEGSQLRQRLGVTETTMTVSFNGPDANNIFPSFNIGGSVCAEITNNNHIVGLTNPYWNCYNCDISGTLSEMGVVSMTITQLPENARDNLQVMTVGSYTRTETDLAIEGLRKELIGKIPDIDTIVEEVLSEIPNGNEVSY